MSNDEKTEWKLTRKEADELRVCKSKTLGLRLITELIESEKEDWWLRVADNHNIPLAMRLQLRADEKFVRYKKPLV